MFPQKRTLSTQAKCFHKRDQDATFARFNATGYSQVSHKILGFTGSVCNTRTHYTAVQQDTSFKHFSSLSSNICDIYGMMLYYVTCSQSGSQTLYIICCTEARTQSPCAISGVNHQARKFYSLYAGGLASSSQQSLKLRPSLLLLSAATGCRVYTRPLPACIYLLLVVLGEHIPGQYPILYTNLVTLYTVTL